MPSSVATPRSSPRSSESAATARRRAPRRHEALLFLRAPHQLVAGVVHPPCPPPTASRAAGGVHPARRGPGRGAWRGGGAPGAERLGQEHGAAADRGDLSALQRHDRDPAGASPPSSSSAPDSIPSSPEPRTSRCTPRCWASRRKELAARYDEIVEFAAIPDLPDHAAQVLLLRHGSPPGLLGRGLPPARHPAAGRGAGRRRPGLPGALPGPPAGVPREGRHADPGLSRARSGARALCSRGVWLADGRRGHGRSHRRGTGGLSWRAGRGRVAGADPARWSSTWTGRRESWRASMGSWPWKRWSAGGGEPVGWVRLPVVDGRCSPDAIRGPDRSAPSHRRRSPTPGASDPAYPLPRSPWRSAPETAPRTWPAASTRWRVSTIPCRCAGGGQRSVERRDQDPGRAARADGCATSASRGRGSTGRAIAPSPKPPARSSRSPTTTSWWIPDGSGRSRPPSRSDRIGGRGHRPRAAG